MAVEAINKTAPGSRAPAFSLPDVVTGQLVSLEALPNFRALLIMFICRHCPYVVHVRGEMLRLAADFQSRGVGMVAICSNDSVKYPDDAPMKLREMALEFKFPFPLLHDESQDVARSYDAACTPDFFLYDAQRSLFYRGRLDDSTPGNGRPVTGIEMRAALEAVLSGQPAPSPQKPSLGCGIKWK